MSPWESRQRSTQQHDGSQSLIWGCYQRRSGAILENRREKDLAELVNRDLAARSAEAEIIQSVDIVVQPGIVPGLRYKTKGSVLPQIQSLTTFFNRTDEHH